MPETLTAWQFYNIKKHRVIVGLRAAQDLPTGLANPKWEQKHGFGTMVQMVPWCAVVPC